MLKPLPNEILPEHVPQQCAGKAPRRAALEAVAAEPRNTYA